MEKYWKKDIVNKYNINQICWFIYSSSASEARVTGMQLKNIDTDSFIKYQMYFKGGQTIEIDEDKLFGTKKELIESL